MKKFIFLLGLAFVLTGCATNLKNQANLPGKNGDGQVNGTTTGGKACTQEAKLCPDGSAVGRTGPNCEFAPCPEPKTVCTCPEGFYLEGEACNPDCYKSTPKCLRPSIACTPAKNTEGNDTGGAGNTGIANPAAVYCQEQGGQSVIVTNPNGSQVGNCILPGGKTCDEWEYFRGTCK